MQQTESTENYLERILMLKKEKGIARAVDIANALGYTKASVSIALKRLQENDLVTVDENHSLDLTPAGEAIASEMYKRHYSLAKIFMKLGVSEKNAYADACKIEHDLSSETYQALVDYFNDCVCL